MGTVSPSLLSFHTNDSHISAAKYIKEGEFNMDQNINFYGIILMLRKLRDNGFFTEKELRKVAARIAAESGVFGKIEIEQKGAKM